MKPYGEIKLKDLKEDYYLLLVDELGSFYIQEFDKISAIGDYYEGLLVVDKLPKEWFTNLIFKEKVRKGKYIEMHGKLGYKVEEMALVELNRFVKSMMEKKFICSIDYDKLIKLIEYRISKIREFINQYDAMKGLCYNPICTDLQCRELTFKKGNIIFIIQNDYQNSFRLFKREIFEDKEIRYNGKTIFHHKIIGSLK